MIRVLVVDDSSLIRKLVTGSLAEDPAIEVVGVAADGAEAVTKVRELEPDAVTLDIEMPVLDGLGALREIRTTHPRLPVIMFSTLTERGATSTLEALSLGASDYVTKPSNTGSVAQSIANVREQLVPKIKALAGARRLAALGTGVPRPTVAPSAPVTAPAPRPARAGRPEALVIGCSTGGPDALSRVLAELPGDLAVPVLVVQHMPPLFTTMFAARLDRECPLPVREAVDGDPVRPGQVLLAPGDYHLRLRRTAGSVRAHLDQGAQVNFCRPAVDPLFASAVETYGGNLLALVLTGMGADGLEGCRAVRGAGGEVVVQDEATSVVWGMPGAVATAGLADAVLPLERVAAELLRHLPRGATVG
ncbi:MAG: protein-glutamate methylesterase/protein-glutamine glutaminase [Marmoricola sp.]